MHYEGDQYPKDVPIVKYDTFDFAANRPDVIFIHNPYDAGNFVTSVHPFFYSDHLRELTDYLIYIPYFVLGEVDPDDAEAVENMKHFCTVAAVFHADRVIVQSEKMRRVYINVLTEAVGKDTRKIWEDKISGLGSPKFDKVGATEKENFKLPESWLKVIEATIESMRPKLWEEYEKLRKQYIEEGFGIYDDSSELNRAIAVSDAYTGMQVPSCSCIRRRGNPL